MTIDDGANGNPPAKPRGSRERPTLHEEELEAILRNVVERARNGNLAAARLCLDLLGRRGIGWNRRKLPVARATAGGVASVMRVIRERVAAGELTLDQGVWLAAGMRPYLRAFNGFRRMVRRLERAEEAAAYAGRAPSELH